MSVSTRQRLEALDPSHLGDIATTLRARAQKYEPEQTQFPIRLRHPGGGEEWTGQASDSLQVKAQGTGKTYGSLHDKLTDGAAQCLQGEEHIATAAAVAKQVVQMTEAMPIGFDVDGKHYSCGQPFHVEDDLTVKVKDGAVPAGAPPATGAYLTFKAQELTKNLARVVQQLNEVSDTWGAKIQAALDLSGLALDSKGQPYTPYDPKQATHDVAKGMADGTVPLPTDPHVLNHLWQQLSPQEKDAIYARYHDIGNHGGIPFDPADHLGRDHYNQIHLKEITDQKQAELTAAQNAEPKWSRETQGQWRQWKAHVEELKTELAGYRNVRETLDRSQKDGLPRYLGIIDGKDHASVSIYNPDKAKDTGILVPGTYADLTKTGDYDTRTKDMINSAVIASHGQLKPGELSMTEWLGFDRPMSIPGPGDPHFAGDPDLALHGGKDLSDYLAGIRSSHDDAAVGGRSYNTVIGHSYGSTEVGAAATHGNFLDADAVVLLASPGSFADSAHGLALPKGAEVFVGKAEFDPIDVANIFGDLLDDVGLTGSVGLGSDPSGWGDAYQMDAGWGGHSSYWDPDNPAMKNIGRILIGQDGHNGVTPR